MSKDGENESQYYMDLWLVGVDGGLHRDRGRRNQQKEKFEQVATEITTRASVFAVDIYSA